MTHETKGSSLRYVVIAVVVVGLAAYVPKAIWPDSTFYTQILTPGILLAVGSTVRLACLAAGAIYGVRSAASLGRENPARLPWLLIGAWLALWTFAQGSLMTYAFVMGHPAPVPSIADAAFLAGYVLMLAAQVRFVFVYRQSGFPIGSTAQHVAIAGSATLVLGLLAYFLLAPIARASLPFGERFVNVSYPVLDLAALVPTVVMIRIALAFRPGRVWAVWASLLVGYVSLAVGDSVAAYLWPAESSPIETWVYLTYLYGYFFTAVGTKLAYDLFTE